jgi:hypothetical protein
MVSPARRRQAVLHLVAQFGSSCHDLRISLNPTTRNGVKAISCFGRIRSS